LTVSSANASVITIETKKITESTAGFCDIIDPTAKLKEHIQQANIRAGTATCFVTGSTAALTTIEHEPGLIQDLKEFVEKYIPFNRRSHFAAGVLTPALIKYRKGDVQPPLETPFNGSTLQAAWSTKNRPRTREIIVQLIGEKE